MGGQTVYQDQVRGFPGQRQGFGHKARSMVNDTGAVRQVHDVTVDVAASQVYQFEIDLGSFRGDDEARDQVRTNCTA